MSFKNKLLNKNIKFEIIKRKKRSISIEITNKAILKISAPSILSESEIFNLISKKEDWIFQSIKTVLSKNSDIINRKYIVGESFLYLGKKYFLNFSDNPYIDFKNQIIYVRKDFIISDLHHLYQKSATVYITKKITKLQKHFNTKPTSMKFSLYKSRWGSCSTKNALTFNYKIILAPPEIVDYIVVHEMAHLIHKNHSKNFWLLVESFIPNYKALRNNLKEITYSLEI